VQERTFEARVTVQGTLEAKNRANVTPRISGTIEAIFVDEGDPVVAGKTRLFQIDALKFRQTVDMRRQDLAVARCALREKQARLEEVEAKLERAEKELRRFENLYKSKSVTIDRLEQKQALYKQNLASRKHARSLVDLERERARQAEVALAIAEKDLNDTLLYAPIRGTVSHRYQETGEMGQVGKPVLRIEDPFVVEVSAYLPAQHYDRIRPGKTLMQLRVSGRDIGRHPVSYRSPTVDTKLRTFEVKCLLRPPPEGVVPGAMARVDVLLEKHEGRGVPAEAVLHRGGKSVVFILEGGVARMVEVATGLETDGYVELRGGAIPKDARVVIKGQTFLNDGAPVAIRKEDL
jgi:RND family efflux transporter MFP subunit